MVKNIDNSEEGKDRGYADTDILLSLNSNLHRCVVTLLVLYHTLCTVGYRSILLIFQKSSKVN